MTRPIASYLTEFGPPRGAAPPPMGALLRFEAARPEPPAETVEERLARAHEAGREEGRRFAEAELLGAEAARAEALAADAAGRLDVERQRWAETEAARFDEALRIGLAALEARIADGVVDVLRPFLAEAVRRKAVAELGEAIASLLTNGAPRVVEVSGPADVIEAMRTRFADRTTVDFRVSEATEVTVLAEPTTIATRIGAWAESLDSHLREPT